MTRYFNILYNCSLCMIICTDVIILMYQLCFYASYIWYRYNMSFNNFHDWNIMSVWNTTLKENKHTNYYHQVLWWMGTYVSTQTVNIVFWNVMCIMNLYIALALLNFHFSCIHAVYERWINSVKPVTHPCAFSVFSDSPDIVWIQVNTLLVTLF